jgi:elongation factor 1-alpha
LLHARAPPERQCVTLELGPSPCAHYWCPLDGPRLPPTHLPMHPVASPAPLCCPGPGDPLPTSGVHVKALRRGHVLSDAKDTPAKQALSFTARVIVLNHRGFGVGYTPVLHCHTCHVACRLTRLQAKVDRRTGAVVEEEPKTVKTHDACDVTLVPTGPVVVEAFRDFPALGRFVVRDNKCTVAVGVVTAVEKGSRASSKAGGGGSGP